MAALLPLLPPIPARAGGAGAPLRVLAATYPAWLAAREAAGDLPGVDVGLLVPASAGCPHDYAMTPADRMRLEEADLVVLVGLGYEAFLDGALPKDPGDRVLSCAEADGSGRDGGNPHVFSDPARFAGMVRAVAGRLSRLEPGLADALSARSAAFSERMAALAADFAALPGAEGVRAVLQHDALAPLLSETGLAVEAVLQEEADESPPPAELLALAARMREGRWLLVGEPQFPSGPLDVLAGETGAPAVTLDPLVSGPVPAPDGLYEAVMRDNLAALGRALAALR